MCEICLRTPCHPQCPNASEPEPVYECDNCGCGIFDGDDVYDINGERWCAECIDFARDTAEANFEDEF